MTRNLKIWVTTMLLTLASGLWAQTAREAIAFNPKLSASNYCVYPDSVKATMTPPPEGRRPFYISTYSRHGSRYVSQRKCYDIPMAVLTKGDSMGLLTPLGKNVMAELRAIIDDAEGRWGEMSGIGKQQLRHIATRMTQNYPEVFAGKARVKARSTTVNRCILSMGTAVQQLVAINPQLSIDMNASKADFWYLNHQDRRLRQYKTPQVAKAFDEYSEKRIVNERLMAQLFTQPDSISPDDQKWLNYYLIKTALIQQNTHMNKRSQLMTLFSKDDLHRFWQIENVWWYVQHGFTPLNGSQQPYTQRHLLRKIIHEADSCILLPEPGAQLRFGHETVLLPLACLLGLNGYDYQTDNLEDLEHHGWWACLIFPMASNIQFVFYRSSPRDSDVIFKVLLNEQEATLPLPTDMAPYYHWRDFRNHYLKMLDDYEAVRGKQ